MRRREFISLISGAAIAPAFGASATRAQQAAMRTIGFLHSASAGAFPGQLAAFRQGLKDSGYIEGQNLTIAYRWAEGRFDRLPDLAADLVRRDVAVIAAMGGPYSNLAAKEATSTIPVVFSTGADPVEMGLVSRLNRPAGNVTGVSFFVEELGAKQLGLLHELVPNAAVVGLLANQANPETPRQSANTVKAARSIGLELEIVNAATPAEIDKAFETLAARRAAGLVIGADALYGSRVSQIVELASRHRIPTIYYRREFIEAGGLICYGTSVNDAYRQAAVYVARILDGAKPGDLPVMQSTKFEFIINLKTAKALGIEVPPGLSARADEVIE